MIKEMVSSKPLERRSKIYRMFKYVGLLCIPWKISISQSMSYNGISSRQPPSTLANNDTLLQLSVEV